MSPIFVVRERYGPGGTWLVSCVASPRRYASTSVMLYTAGSSEPMIVVCIAVVRPAAVKAVPENVGGAPVGFAVKILRESGDASNANFALALHSCAPSEPSLLSGNAFRSP